MLAWLMCPGAVHGRQTDSSDDRGCLQGKPAQRCSGADLVAQAGEVAGEGARDGGVGQDVVEHDVGGGDPAGQHHIAGYWDPFVAASR